MLAERTATMDMTTKYLKPGLGTMSSAGYVQVLKVASLAHTVRRDWQSMPNYTLC